MIGNNGYYQPYTTQIPNTMNLAPYQQTSGLVNTFVPVRGIEEAKNYIVAAGNSVMLMDMNDSRFYIKTVDATGIAQPLRIYEFKEVKDTPAKEEPKQEFVTKEEFDKALSELKKNNYKKGDK